MIQLLPFAPVDRLPTTIVTGFLGSGKTTLINRLLRQADLSDAAVIVNEFGEIGIDNDLIEKVDGNTTLLESGCVCCTVRDELSLTMRDLMVRREEGSIPRFRRLVIETTGLADPGPIAHHLVAEPLIATHYTLAAVVTTVDAVNGSATLWRHPEAVRQAALADRLILTKTDMPEAPQGRSLLTELRQINPSASILRAAEDALDAGILASALTDPVSDASNLQEWLGEAEHGPHHEAGHSHHDHGIQTFSLIDERPITWAQLARWLQQLGREDGDRLLRVKGVINVVGLDGPAVIHGVQRVIHLPIVLPAWPNADRRTRIVFITDGLDRERIGGLFESAIGHG